MLNQVTLVGRLTRDPEIKRTMDGNPVTNVTVAINRHFKNQKGELEADFIPCTIWRRAAENTALYCKKGSMVGITGRLQTRHYENQEGKRIYVTEVIADSIQFIDTKSASAPPPKKEEPKKEEALETLEDKILK